MAAYNKQKSVKQTQNPQQKVIREGGVAPGGVFFGSDPNSIMREHPVWRLASCDVDESVSWAFYQQRLSDDFWNVIFPHLRDFEKRTWSDIFINAKKHNHAIDVRTLNKCARDRLSDLRVEAEAIYSLKISGKVRIYGYLTGSVYNILWYDDDHGDNETCVCRSMKKHT